MNKLTLVDSFLYWVYNQEKTNKFCTALRIWYFCLKDNRHSHSFLFFYYLYFNMPHTKTTAPWDM